VSTTVLIVELR